MAVLGKIVKGGLGIDVQPFLEENVNKQKQLGAEFSVGKKKKEEEIADLEANAIDDEASTRDEKIEKAKQEYLEWSRDMGLRFNTLKKTGERLTDLQNRTPEQSVQDKMDLMAANQPGTGHAHSNPEARATVIYNRISALMTETKNALRTKVSGLVQNKTLYKEVVRYLKDGKVQNGKYAEEAKRLAEQWKEASDKLRVLRNKAGGAVGELEDWVIPQTHNKVLIRKIGVEGWKAFIKPLLDVDRVEAQQGKSIDEILESAYRSIVSVEKDQGFSATLAKRHEESRVLHFKDGDSILKYNEEFGNSDIFSVMDNHIRSQSQEIAHLQLYGANPDYTQGVIKEIMDKEAMELGVGSGAQIAKIETLNKLSSGQLDGDNVVGFADKMLASGFGAFRAIGSASMLGSAMISALADPANVLIWGAYRRRLFTSFKILGKGFHAIVKDAFAIGSTSENVLAASKLGLISEFASASLANTRFAGEAGATGAQKAAEVVIRSSGLGSWTNTFRAVAGLEINSMIYKDFNKKYDQLDFKDLLEEYGITEVDWDIIRSSTPKELKSVNFDSNFIDMEDIFKLNTEVGYKFSEMISNEVDGIIVNPVNRTRRYITGGKKKGTWGGEVQPTLMMFKSFPITLTLVHAARMKGMTKGGKTAYAATFLTTSTAFGALALWAHDIVTGKTPRDPEGREGRFIMEAVAKGGGLGIFGDIVTSVDGESAYGKKFSTTLAGPIGGAIDDVVGIVNEAIKEAAGDRRASAGSELLHKLKNWTPGQNLWWARRTVTEEVVRQLEMDHDPKFRQRQAAKRRRMRDKNQEELYEYLLD